MQIWILVQFFFILAFRKVEAKAVDRSNHVSNTGSSSSDQLSSQLVSISEQDTEGLEGFKISAPSMIGKPLYFKHDSTHKSEPSTNRNYEHSSTDRLELSNYENLERMFDTILEVTEEHFDDPKSKTTASYLSYENDDKKPNKNGEILKADQVFVHKNAGKSGKAKLSDERGGVESLHFQSHNKKPRGVGPPCANAHNDFHNKSENEHSIVSNFNIDGVKYTNQYEQQPQSNIYISPSKNVQQHQKIIHENVDIVRTESSELLESDAVKDNFGGNIQKGDNTEKKSERLSIDRTGNIDLEEIPSNNKRAQLKSHQNIDIQSLETSSKTEENKQVLKNAEVNRMDSSFKSFVFNPNAEPQEVFQECKTPKNESGYCRYIQHCMLPSILGSIRHFMDNVCIIKEQFIGVCCPEFPVQSILVSWPDRQSDFGSVDETVEVPKDCGVGTNKRIIGGLAADRKAWPWMVALLNSRKKFFCGGSLINNRYVLTAAHCTFGPSNNRIIARLGEYDFNDPREPHDDYLVIEIKRHGQYARFTLRNDIAVLKLERPVVFNEFVRTICLPDADKDYLGKTVTLAGWGHLNGASSSSRSDILQEASFPVIENDECSKSHGVPIAPSIVCAAAPGKDKGACNGDSGGPLMLLDSDERWKVVGIVSWGRRGCNPKFPTAYSRVTNYLDWIKEHTIL